MATPTAAQCGDNGSSCTVCSGAPECKVDICRANGTCGTANAADEIPCDGGNGTCTGGTCIPN
ncbi:MAG: hypothetical protein IPG96_19020 [Proteobacteria bacterium]|nr:hypothetical protein [Pseudomonadota bacterium]